MIERRIVFEIHRLADQGTSIRKIARTLGLGRDSVAKYLRDPQPARVRRRRGSKLDPFKNEIERLLALDPEASAEVVRQRLAEKGFRGGITILRDHLRKVRPPAPKRAYIRFESPPGEQCQIDWGEFGSLAYGRTRRKLYCLAVLECHSRLLYLHFTHSQKQAALHQGLLSAFSFMGGTCREMVVDNMLTAVTERVGPAIRFNEAFLEFLRPFKIAPYACNKRQPQEKGKVENVIGYIKGNFWPLRSFRDLCDVNAQAARWRDETANARIHAATGRPPRELFQPEKMRPLPEYPPDCRETLPVKVHKDFAVRFDANAYSVPPWAVGKTVIVKADPETVYIYDGQVLIAEHRRGYERKMRIETPQHVEAARAGLRREWRSREVEHFVGLGPLAQIYLEKMAAAGRALGSGVKKLIGLEDEYGRAALLEAMEKADAHGAYGADYIENILRRNMNPKRNRPPLQLLQERLNRIRLEEPSLAEYDALVLRRRNERDR